MKSSGDTDLTAPAGIGGPSGPVSVGFVPPDPPASGTAAAKKEALEAVGVRVGKTPSETARLMREIVSGA